MGHARGVVDEEVKKNMHKSRVLVDHAADGNVEKLLEELKGFADPNSEREGVTALEAAVNSGVPAAVELLLLDFKASLSDWEGGLLLEQVSDNPEMVRVLEEGGAKPLEVPDDDRKLIQWAKRNPNATEVNWLSKKITNVGAQEQERFFPAG